MGSGGQDREGHGRRNGHGPCACQYGYRRRLLYPQGLLTGGARAAGLAQVISRHFRLVFAVIACEREAGNPEARSRYQRENLIVR